MGLCRYINNCSIKHETWNRLLLTIFFKINFFSCSFNYGWRKGKEPSLTSLRCICEDRRQCFVMECRYIERLDWDKIIDIFELLNSHHQIFYSTLSNNVKLAWKKLNICCLLGLIWIRDKWLTKLLSVLALTGVVWVRCFH